LTAAATGLAAADATILTATRSRHATLLTFDSDFAGIPDVVVLER
jgi:predicted nucleic acid-binding protein